MTVIYSADQVVTSFGNSDLLEPGNVEHLDKPLFLPGHGVENPADVIHDDEEYRYVVAAN